MGKVLKIGLIVLVALSVIGSVLRPIVPPQTPYCPSGTYWPDKQSFYLF